jgi:hypothetical protein
MARHPSDRGWLFIRGVHEIGLKYGVTLIHVDNSGNVTIEGNVEPHILNCFYNEIKALSTRLLGLSDPILLTRFSPVES